MRADQQLRFSLKEIDDLKAGLDEHVIAAITDARGKSACVNDKFCAISKVMHDGNETILLAEDDPSLRASLRITLTRRGYHVLEAPTGVKAMEVWKENRDEIRLLLTDIMMPGEMTGDVLAQGILRENPKLKVIYMSGYSAEAADKDFPLKEGVNFLTKPFPAAKLAQAIRESLDAM